MLSLTGQTLLLTGASMGIGACLAKEFADQGAKLILTARTIERLEEICDELRSAPFAPEYIPCDFSDPAQVEELAQTLLNRGPIDGLIHNAGVGLYGSLEKVSLPEVRRLFEVNFFSVYQLTHRLFPLLAKAKNPRILLVSSVISWRSIPRMAAYCASKAALNMLAESLRIEATPYGIKIINSYPGRTRTEFTQNAQSFGWKPFSTERHGTPADKVAKKLCAAYRKGKRDEWVTCSNRVIAWLNFFWPGLIDWGFKKYFKNK